MKYFVTLFAAASMMACVSCDILSGSGGSDTNDTTKQEIDSTTLAVDSVNVVRGKVVDGSRRNIYVQVGDSTYSFEFDDNINVEWDEGDSLLVRYITTKQGDSVLEVKNTTQTT